MYLTTLGYRRDRLRGVNEFWVARRSRLRFLRDGEVFVQDPKENKNPPSGHPESGKSYVSSDWSLSTPRDNDRNPMVPHKVMTKPTAKTHDPSPGHMVSYKE